MGSFVEAQKTLEGAFAAGWGGLYPHCFENTPAPITTGPWVRLTFLWGNARQLDIGSTAPFEEQIGVIVVQVFLPGDAGTRALYEVADVIRTIFGRKTFATGSGGKLTTFAPRIVKVGRITTTGGETDWQQHSVQVSFRIDEVFAS